MPQPTPKYRLLDHLLPNGLPFFVGQRRGAGKSWRTIAQDIEEATGINVTFETLRLWFPDRQNGEPGEAA